MTPSHLHFVVPGPIDQRTGGYLYDAHVVDGLRRLGWTVDVLSLAGSFPDADDAARSSMDSTLEGLPDGALVVVDGLAMGGLPTSIRANGPRLRILSLVHHPLADETGLSEHERARFTALERDALEPCTGVIVTSASTARRLGDFGVRADRVRVVLPGTEPVRAAEGPAVGAPPVMICVGTVTPRKGYDVLVRALARVGDLPWSCRFAGSLERDPVYAGAVLALVQDAGLGNRIDFVGELDAPALDELYHGASLFVLASHYEGYGMALAEALARGLPVVSTTGGAIPHTVPSDAGVLVEPGDASAFADALRRVLTDATVREALSDSARRHARQLPSWATAATAFAAAVTELTA